MWEDLSRLHKDPWRSEPRQKKNMIQRLPVWPGGGHTVPSPCLPSPTPVLGMEGNQALVLCTRAWGRRARSGRCLWRSGTAALSRRPGSAGLLTHPCAFWLLKWLSVQFSSVAQSCPTLCDPMNHSMPGLPVHHHLPELTQTHVHRVSDAIQPSHPLSFPFPPVPNPSQHQSLFQWVNSSHEVAKVLEFQL